MNEITRKEKALQEEFSSRDKDDRSIMTNKKILYI